MNKKYLALSVMSLFIATACSQKEEQKTEKKTTAAAVSTCRHASVPAQLHDDLQAAIIAETQNYIKSDSHQFIDIDKMTAAASQLKVTINGIQDKDNQCRGKLSIVIPQNVQKVASTYAPLVGITQYDTIIEERMGSANFQFNGSTLTLPINFTVNGEPISITQTDDTFKTATTALTAALLPYAVKDNINVAGRMMTREMGLQAVQMNGGKLPAAPAPKANNSQPETPAATTPSNNTQATSNNTETDTPRAAATPKPKPVVTAPPKPVETPEQKALREARAAERAAKIAEAKAAERAAKAKAAREAAEAAKLKAAEAKAKAEAAATAKANTAKPADDATSSLTPSKNTANETKTVEAPKPRVSDDELDNVRKAHSQADQEIKSSWKKITPEIQKELVEEQKSWEKQRNQRCRQAAAAGADESEANKLYMQCDTRMTKERVKNLEGYSIP